MHAFIRCYHKISQRPLTDTTGPFPCTEADLATETAFRAFVAKHGFRSLGNGARHGPFRCEKTHEGKSRAVFIFDSKDTSHALVVEMSDHDTKYGFLGYNAQVFIVHFGRETGSHADLFGVFASEAELDACKAALAIWQVPFNQRDMVARRGYAYLRHELRAERPITSAADMIYWCNHHGLAVRYAREITDDAHDKGCAPFLCLP